MHRFALLLYSLGAGTAALTGDLTLTLGTNTGTAPSPMFQLRDPNGSNRNVLLPLLTGTQSESTGIWYFIRNTGSANNLVVKDSTGVTTYATLAPGQWAWMLSSGTTATWQVVASLADLVSLTLTGALTAVGITNNSTLDQNGNIDHDTTQAASGAGLDTLTQVSSATGSPDAVVVGLTQITNNRSSGTATALDITVTGRAGDVGGTYEAIRGTPVLNGGSATAIFAKVAAGFTRLFDLSETATGEGNVMLADNLADAFSIRQASTYLMKVVTTTGAKIVQFAQGIGADSISEVTSAAGVTVDGCLIKDGRAALLATAGMFSSTEQTGTGSSQNVAHGFGAAPSMWWAVPTDTTAGWVVSAASQDATNISITVTTGAKFRVYALK